MGSANDIMQTFAQKEVHAQFPGFDGWRCDPVTLPGNSCRAYRVSRYHRGQNQQGYVAVSFDQKPSADLAATLKTIPRERKGFQGYFLFVPKDADVSEIPEGIQVLSMRSFGVVNSRITWLTKNRNVKRYTPEEPVAA